MRAMNAPFFSVIIPTFNRAGEIRRALESLALQTLQDFEVIVCDDGSTDQTEQVVDSFRAMLSLIYLREQNWGGPARPRNKGLKRARGSWICFLDSDDWWYPHKLERIRELCQDADLVYHDCHAVTGDGRRKKRIRGRNLQAPVFEDLMLGWNPLVNSATCVRKSVLDKSGGFDEDRRLIAVEDFDLWLRIARITERYLYIPEVLGAYVLSDGNISQFSEQSLARERVVSERHAHLLNQERRQMAMRMVLYRQGLIYWHLGQGAKSRDRFLKALFPLRWRHRLLVFPWIMLSFFRRGK